MKAVKLLFVPVLLISLVLTACSSNAQPATSASPAETTAETTEETTQAPGGAELSEAAMDNFLKKVDAGNYTIDANDYQKISVFSRDLITFEYSDEAYRDFVAMSVNNETFQAFLNDGVMTDAEFVSEGQAIEVSGSKLLNYWMSDEASDGNIYNLFYNSIDEPLTFSSHDEVVKSSLASFMGYSSNAVRLMEDVYMEMDDVDPTVVHLKAVMNEDVVARISYDDIDVVVTFGDAKGNAPAEAWMNDPAYPAARTDWNDTDYFIFNSVFSAGYGNVVIPFPQFASYAFTIDGANFLMTGQAAIREPHGTEQDKADYINQLLADGFSEVKKTAEDGTETTCYRKILREEYLCYTSVKVEYNNGVNIIAEKYYDSPSYEGLDAVNEAITAQGYLPLPADENIKSISGYDRAKEMTEGWMYFFDYNLGLELNVEYEDHDKAAAYLESYAAELMNSGFTPVYADDEINYYESPNKFSSFRYHFDDDGALSLLFKAERYISPDEAEALLAGVGFPAIDLREPITCRDLVKNQKLTCDVDFKLFLTVSQIFDTVEEAENFLNDYEAALTAAGFDRSIPEFVYSNKPVKIYNEEADMMVAIDLVEQANNVFVGFDFWAK